MRLKYRSSQKEFLDSDTIDTKDLYQNLKELDFINEHLGGYRASRKGLLTLIRSKNIKTVMDIGFGGGDAIKQLDLFSKKHKHDLFFYGVDLKQDCVNYAEKNLIALTNKKLICSDYRDIPLDLMKRVDLIHCSLFLHHLKNDEIVDLFRFARENQCAILANDLHRNILAYYSIKWLTALFSESYLVKNDAAVSVTRGFRKKELLDLLQQSGYKNYSVTWSWAFRFIVIARS